MFTSLRSRLWFSYALTVIVALGVVSIVLFIYLVRNPLVYRQEAARLLVVQNILLKNQAAWSGLSPEELDSYLEQMEGNFGARILVFNQARKLLADSGDEESDTLRLPRLTRVRLSNVLRDLNGTPWLYLLRQAENRNWVVVAVIRPPIPFQTIIGDDLFLPVVGAGITALLLSLLLAFMISKWVGDPLQRVMIASREMPKGDIVRLKEEGPREVKDLIRVFNDMTARINASQQSQRQFVADVSHELKTPITIIQGFAQAIMDGTAESKESNIQAARLIFDETGRMHRLVMDLLDLAKIDAGTLVLGKESVDINLLLIHLSERFKPALQEASVYLTYDPQYLPPVYGDSDRLAQVFTNLIDNGIKFTPPGGKIEMVASNDAIELRVAISDSGIGINENDISHVFDRFYQSDPSRKGGERHGSGLGLAIAREIVLAHHGTITARSTPGRGSTFTVILPLAVPNASTVVRRRDQTP